MSSYVFAVGPIKWIPDRSQSKWSLAADPWCFCISPAVGGQVRGSGVGGSCISDWFILNVMRSWRALVCSLFLCVSHLETLWKGHVVHAPGSVALMQSHLS